MALQAVFSPFLVSSTPLASLRSSKNNSSNTYTVSSIRCVAPTTTTDDTAENRRSANYIPRVWDYDLVQSFNSDYNDQKFVSQVDKVKEDVKCLIDGVMEVPLAKLELIDTVQRLGLKYHFEKEIKKALDSVYNNDSNNAWFDDSLYATALRFRLLRQHGYDVPQGVFERFMDDKDSFKAALCGDVKGLLSLYEASFFGFKGERIIDEAKTFTTTELKDTRGHISPSLARKVSHALDMPLHWRLTRLEARWFIDTCEQEEDMNPTLLQLAKLDYNIVWWVDLGLDKMSFARDRLMEHYLWCNGMVSEPQYGAFREMSTKIISLITTIDDIYDVYGSMEELELFTDYVDRWDFSEVDKLPLNIRTVLLALCNTSNEIGYWTLKERGFNIVPYLAKRWADQCKAYFKEAGWFHGGYKPTMDEYLDHAVVSIGAHLMLFCGYFLTTNDITEEALDCLDKLPSITRSSCLLTRLANDLGTSSDELERGDNLKSVHCYMNETGATEEEARAYINGLAHETWKIMNKDMLGSYPFSEPSLSASPNIARTAQCFYQYGDGHGVPDRWTKDHLTALLVQPIHFNYLVTAHLYITCIDVRDQKYASQVDKIKEDVKGLINGVMEVPLAKLELIDTVQRLGLKYHFEEEIKKALDVVYNDNNDAWFDESLYATALRFRLLRQHGYDVPQDVFERFMDDNGSFKAGLRGSVKGLLSLYEASFFGFEGESIIDEAKTFATSQLKDVRGDISPSLAKKVSHALDMPLHWRLTRVEARWWVDLGLDKMSFARDRLMEHYLWCNGMVSEPQYGAFREMATKIISLITTIDDIYDVYGFMEEVELFTAYIDRWNISEIDKLLLNIRTVLLAMYNTSNQIGYWTLKERGFNIIPYLSKMWADLCKAYLKEAGWFHGGYKQTLDEYLDNAVVSIAAPLMLFCAYFLTTNNITEEALNYIDKLPSIMRSSSLLLRLTDDFGTSSVCPNKSNLLSSIQKP
ncbi:hypothetical protein RJ640_004214 [Escallonia rubra]|uniref:Uncharacterized protein n=1 Tax=Escallonia rubra TaxID=112253 RepID=A0AA88QH47_9ASTE|nr:hypothetical protein RJ640_004214 [Escallonia rubra]